MKLAFLSLVLSLGTLQVLAAPSRLPTLPVDDRIAKRDGYTYYGSSPPAGADCGIWPVYFYGTDDPDEEDQIEWDCTGPLPDNWETYPDGKIELGPPS